MTKTIKTYLISLFFLFSYSSLQASQKGRSLRTPSLKKIITSTLFSSLLPSSGFSTEIASLPTMQLKNIYLPEDSRTYVEPFSNSSRVVGKLTFTGADGNSYSCTGNLVWRDYVLTNGHCIFNDVEDVNGKTGYRGLGENFVFRADYNGGISVAESSCKAVIGPRVYSSSGDLQWTQDWFLCQLEKPLGDAIGWAQIERNAYETDYPDDDNTTYYLTGYSGDKCSQTPCTTSCELKGTEPYQSSKVILENCDSTKGSSGSGIFYYKRSEDPEDTNYYHTISAIHHGYKIAKDEEGNDLPETDLVPYSSQTANEAVETKEAYDVLAYLINERKDEDMPEYTNSLVPEGALKPPAPELGDISNLASFKKDYVFYEIDQESEGQIINDITHVVEGVAGTSFFFAIVAVSHYAASQIKKNKDKNKDKNKGKEDPNNKKSKVDQSQIEMLEQGLIDEHLPLDIL